MNTIQRTTGIITAIRDLSPTAREYTITPEEPLPFVAGAFVNVFLTHDGKTIRRAFSMSSSDQNPHEFTLSIRLSQNGELTPLLWAHDFTNATVNLMGPLGLNTADKMKSPRVFLFGFGVGAGVVKSLTDHMLQRDDLSELTIVTGNRSIPEILHRDYFDAIAAAHPHSRVTYVVSDTAQYEFPTGYIQDHISQYDFSGADVYMCGQGIACTALHDAIAATKPEKCTFFIEDFH